MKRLLAGVVLSAMLSAASSRAADAATLAAQQEAEERYRRLAATMEEIQVMQATQQRQISALASDLSKLRDEVSRNNNRAAVEDALKRLNEQIMDVDKARVADNRKIYEAIEKLGQAIKNMPAPPQLRPQPGPGSAPAPAAPSNGNMPGNVSPSLHGEFYEYTIQSRDTLSGIVQAYRQQNIPVTQKSVEEANPNVNWNKLRVGQKILIPKPR